METKSNETQTVTSEEELTLREPAPVTEELFQCSRRNLDLLINHIKLLSWETANPILLHIQQSFSPIKS